jgi:hypothetical protein
LHLFVPVHAVPSGALLVEHVPLFGSHEPATWHASGAVHVSAEPPMHAPP